MARPVQVEIAQERLDKLRPIVLEDLPTELLTDLQVTVGATAAPASGQ